LHDVDFDALEKSLKHKSKLGKKRTGSFKDFIMGQKKFKKTSANKNQDLNVSQTSNFSFVMCGKPKNLE
jgi:hypothetical protein